MKLDDNRKIIFSVAGGKGGVGKSIFSVALAVKLAMDGKRVTLVDLDLGAANLHTYLGIIKETPTIADFILKKVPSLEDILTETSQENLRIIRKLPSFSLNLRKYLQIKMTLANYLR